MPANIVEQYPQGRVAIGSGEWQHLTDCEFTYENGAELITTTGGVGYTTGPRKGSASFNSAIGVDGQDLDTLKKVKNAEPVQVRFKFPGKAATMTGVFTQSKISFPHDKNITESCEVIGVFDFS